MKKTYILFIMLFGMVSVQSQELKWHNDVKEAIAIGNKEKKPLLLFFTGSDWCGWCIRLQKEVLLTPEFSKWAKENVVLVELDYPNKKPQLPAIKQQNAELQQIFGIQGFPTIYLTNTTKEEDGRVNFKALGKTGYVAGGPVAWLSEANKILQTK